MKFCMSYGMASIQISKDDWALNGAVEEWLLNNAVFQKRGSLTATSATIARNIRGLKTSPRYEKFSSKEAPPCNSFSTKVDGLSTLRTPKQTQSRSGSWGYSPEPIKKLLLEIQAAVDGKRQIVTYTAVLTGPTPTWTKRSAGPSRSFDSVCLDSELKDELINFISDYLHPED